jgi:hypothetical protein
MDPHQMRRLLQLLNASMLFVLGALVCSRAGDDILHVLQPDNIDRLRLDFNASRSKVRLVFMLSPT